MMKFLRGSRALEPRKPRKNASAIKIPAWHVKILKQRLSDAEKKPGVGTPWEVVLEELRQKRKDQ